MFAKRRLIPLLTTFVLAAVTIAYLVFAEGRALNVRLYNKAAGDVSVLLLSLVLLIGPLGRKSQVLARWLNYRKNLGLWALLAASVHGYLSLITITNGNFMRYFTRVNWAPITGLASLILLLILGWYSVDKLIGKMDRKLWWKLQQYGVRLATILALTHVLILKWPGWNWSEFSTKLPPFNLIVSLITAVILLVRITDWLRKAR